MAGPMELSLRLDKEEFCRLLEPVIVRVSRIGIAEAERRMGCSFEELVGDMVEVVTSNDGLTIYLRPSQRLTRAVDAILETRPLLRAIGRA